MMQYSRRTFLKMTGFTTAASMFSGCGSAWMGELNNNKPNIIYILADDLGYGDLGCYGQKEIKTPVLDRMAAEGMRFTQHYAGSTVCAPSRCVLMTGMHTGHARIRSNARIPLLSDDVTVAEQLKQAGYTTAIIGKWGLGENDTSGAPNKQGFDYFFGYLDQLAAHNHYPEYLWENDQKINLPNVVDYVNPPGGVSTNKRVYSHNLFMKKALNFIDTQKNTPFFLYLALTIPHANNEAGKKGMEVPNFGIYKDKDWPEPQKGHAAMITKMDADIAKIFDRLKMLGIDENTIVMFSSDNGPHAEGGNDPNFNDSNGPLRGIKRDLYEGGIRVPLIVRWPGKIKADSQSDHISGFQDFLPTCAEITGVPALKNIDGISFLPTLLGQHGTQREHPYLYWEFYEQGGKQAVRMGKWKAVRLKVLDTPQPTELYDLNTDIGEFHNVAAEHPALVKKIEQMMKASHTATDVYSLYPSERS